MSRSTAFRRLLPAPLDVVATIVLTGFVVGATSGLAHWHDSVDPAAGPGIGIGAIIWLIAGVLPVLQRRAFPLLAFLVSAALVISYYSSGYPDGPSAAVPVLLLVSLAFFRGPVVAGGAGTAAWLAVFVLALVNSDHGLTDPSIFGTLVLALAAVAVGTAGRTQRSARLATRARAESEDRRRIEEERLRIAREVHDVVAHSLAMINVQAGVAAHVADRRPEQAKEALLAIKEASRIALTDLRATLNVLRSGEGRAPTPGLQLLPELVATAAAAGLRVVTDGDTDGLPAPVDVAAYRIVQESLTNVVRHADGADTVHIGFTRTADELRIEVRDNGRGPANTNPTTGGNGLRGMAERAQALGGGATAGPADNGGFTVYARLPVNPIGGAHHD
ncbi:MAG TPA: sensor histidine kinase [Pseudonocardiaceae bacterium]|jgi:signal transduction histidine kinase|nr:sensor histidine kinase [Pseudonocardiaceae bacterium]